MPNRIKDLSGLKFNKLTVIEVTNKRTKDGHRLWACLCDCGNFCEFSSNELQRKRNDKLSCGCQNIKDLTGQTFGRLTVIKETGKRKERNVVWLCQCECGNTCEVKSNFLIRGEIRSCGCLQREHMEIFMSKRVGAPVKIGKKLTTQFRSKVHGFVKKERVLEKYNKCLICDSTNNIHLHHLYNTSHYPEFALDSNNLISLCSDCHGSYHDAMGFGGNTPLQFIEFYEAYI